jgi:hypothetical protein
MAPHRDAALEAQQEVLPHGLHPLEREPVDRGRHAGRRAARMWGDRLHPFAHECLELRRGAVEHVSLRHLCVSPY